MDFSITTALILKVSNIKAGLNSRGGRLTAPCLRKEKIQVTTFFFFLMGIKYFFTPWYSWFIEPNLLFPLGYHLLTIVLNIKNDILYFHTACY